jgi:NADPH2:quinone reductase
MRYERVIVTRYGGPEVISLIEEDLPAPQPEEVRVKVLAAGVSLPDVLARARASRPRDHEAPI